MSFLPHAAPRAVSWYGSLTASAVTHGGVVGFFLYSGAVAFLPAPVVNDPNTSQIAVIEILDADPIDDAQLLDDPTAIPDDAEALAPEELTSDTAPEDLDALAPDDSATLAEAETDALAPDDVDTLAEAEVADDTLAPDDADLLPEAESAAALAPEDLSALTPEAVDAAAPEPEVIEPEVAEPVVTEPEDVLPEPVTPEVTEPEIAAPEPQAPEITEPTLVAPEAAPIDPQLADVAPDSPATDDQPTDLPAAPLVPEVADPSPLDIAGLSPVDDTVLSPLGEGGAPAPDPDVLTLTTPDTTAPVLTQPEVTQPEATGPDTVDGSDVLAALVPQDTAVPPVLLPEEDGETPAVLPAPEDTPDVADPLPAEDTDAATDAPDSAADSAVDSTEDGADTGDDTAAPAAPAPQPLANPSASDIAIGQLIRRIRATAQPQCTLALPRRATGTPGAGVSFVGADPAVLDTLAAQITDGLPFEPVQTREEIDPRQCATLDVVRQADSYPASRIGLALDAAALSSGDTLSGRVIGAGGLFVTLLLIDDNGVVQDLAPFVRLDGTTPVFEAPVARSGPTRATRQILLALGTAGAPLDLSDRIGRLAQDVFAPVPAETLRGMVFGIATFDVR